LSFAFGFRLISDNELEELYACQDWHGMIQALAPRLGLWVDDVLRARGCRRTADLRQELVAEGALALTLAFSRRHARLLQGADHIRNYARKAVKCALGTYLHEQEIVCIKHSTIKKRRARRQHGDHGRPTDPRHASDTARTAQVPDAWDGRMPWERGQRLSMDKVSQPLREDRSGFWMMIDSLVATTLQIADGTTREAVEILLTSQDSASVESAAKQVGVNRRTLADRLNRLGRVLPQMVPEEVAVMAAEFLGNRWKNPADSSAESGIGP
jgi:hypothetical protein